MPDHTLHSLGKLGIDAELCAHTRIAHATCKHCVAVCPTQAWSMDDTGLNFDAERCDACGLCVAACPHEALSVPAPLAMVSQAPQPRVLMACDRSAHGQLVPRSSGTHVPGVTACLHSLSPAWLQETAVRHQAPELLLLSGSCAQCQRRPEQMLHARWQAWIDRAAGAAAPAPRLTWATSAQWSAAAQDAKPLAPNRRKLLFRLMPPQQTDDSGPRQHVLTSGRRAATAHVKQSAPGNPQVMPFWQVALDAAPCNWCMACLRLCPTGVFRLSVASDQVRGLFAVDSNLCTGCGLCAEVCDVNAIAIHEPVGTTMATADPPRRLQRLACSACRMKHWRWVDSPLQATDTLCAACQGGKTIKQHRIIDRDTADNALAPTLASRLTQPTG